MDSIEQMRKSGKIWVWADKSRNISQISPNEYKWFLNNKITESYKTDYNNIPVLINSDTSKFMGKLHIKDRLRETKRKIWLHFI